MKLTADKGFPPGYITDGKLIVLKFKAKDGAKAGNYKITVESSSMGSVEEKLVNP